MVLEDRVTDTSELFKYDKLVLGEGVEKNLENIYWKPFVHKGNIYYLAGKNANVYNFAEQFNLSINIAKSILKKESITEGKIISGKTVRSVLGTPILKLNLKSKLAISQVIFDQLIFAIDASKIQNKIGFFTNDFFSNFMGKPNLYGIQNNKAILNGTIFILFTFPLYNEQHKNGKAYIYPYFISNTPYKSEQNYAYWNGKVVFVVNLYFKTYLTFNKDTQNYENLIPQGLAPCVFTSYAYNEDKLWERFL